MARTRCEGLIKVHRQEGLEVVALQGLDIEALPGEVTALVGPSGSGKTSLLMVLAAQDEPTAGRAWVAGVALHDANESDRRFLRRSLVSLVFQDPSRNLLPRMTPLANVALPIALAGGSRKAARARAAMLLDQVGMADRAGESIEHLSGGEQQRVAVAVALASDPPVLLADEPTAELDAANAEHVVELLQAAASEGRTVLVTTHDETVAERAHRVIHMRDGRVESSTVFGEEQMLAVDSRGRVQLPAELREAAGIIDKARAHVVDGGILLSPPEGGTEQ